MSERIQKSEQDKLIAGVCGGLAEYFGVDPVLVRLAFVVITLIWGAGLLIYLVLAIIMPKPDDRTGPTAETVRRNLDELTHEAQERARELNEALQDSEGRRRSTFAVLLILVGVLLLASQAGALGLISWLVIAPVLLIALGLAVLLGIFQRPPTR